MTLLKNLKKKMDCLVERGLIYRITTVIKVETYIKASISASPIGQSVILVIIYVNTFTTDEIIFTGNVI